MVTRMMKELIPDANQPEDTDNKNQYRNFMLSQNLKIREYSIVFFIVLRK